MLAHGWTETLGFWTYVIRDLTARGMRVVAYDLRGHGQSEPAPGGDYEIARFGEDLEAVLEASVRDGERAVVAGHSLGAMSIAAWAASARRRAPRERCRAAEYRRRRSDRRESAGAGPGDRAAAEPELRSRPECSACATPVPRFSTPASHAMIRYIAFGPAATPAQVAFYERMLVACPPDVRADAGIAISEIELRDAIPRLTVPDDRDRRRARPAHPAVAFAADRRSAAAARALIVLPETGHMAPLERPREVSDALAGLAETAARRTAHAAAS